MGGFPPIRLGNFLQALQGLVGIHRNDSRQPPLLPHLVDLRLEVVDVVVDEAGVREACAAIRERVEAHQPGAVISTQGQDVNGGDTVQLSATVSDPDEEDVTFEWTGAGDFSTASGTISHPYTDTADTTWTAPAKTDAAQEVMLTLSASDGTSTSTAKLTMTVRANSAPEAAIQTAEQEVAGEI